MQCDVTDKRPLAERRLVTVGLLLLLVALGGLFYYKWAGSIRTVESVRAQGTWTKSADAITTGGVLSATIEYFGRVWLALLFGILIGAVVRALISPRWVAGLLGKADTWRRQIAGVLTGAPLMLCSCCVTPIFTSVYELGARLGSALAVMLASPGLNVAALVLTFMLFPVEISLARLGAALAAVFILPLLLESLFGASVQPVRPSVSEEDAKGPRTFGEFATRFVESLAYLTAVTVPMIAAGVLVSSLILPFSLSNSKGGTLVALLVVGAISVLVALPTFFEIPLAILLMQMGTPGGAVAMLFAGPIINMPSLFILARQTNAKVAGALATGIWLLAIGAGLVVAL